MRLIAIQLMRRWLLILLTNPRRALLLTQLRRLSVLLLTTLCKAILNLFKAMSTKMKLIATRPMKLWLLISLTKWKRELLQTQLSLPSVLLLTTLCKAILNPFKVMSTRTKLIAMLPTKRWPMTLQTMSSVLLLLRLTWDL